MARQTIKAKVINVVDDPRISGNVIVTLRFNDGSNLPDWDQSWSINNDGQEAYISLEKFIQDVKGKIARPFDPYKFLREAIDTEVSIDFE